MSTSRRQRADKAMQIFDGYGAAKEGALGDTIADRLHGKAGLRDVRRDKTADDF